MIKLFCDGAQKALGWFGGYGWDGTMGFFTQQMGMPALMAGFVILLELLGPLLLVAGFATRAVALGFVGLMVGAIATVLLHPGGRMGPGVPLIHIGVLSAIIAARWRRRWTPGSHFTRENTG